MTVCCNRLPSCATRAFTTGSESPLGRNKPNPSGARIGLALLLLGCTSAAQAAIPASERAVLTSLYTSTNGASWKNKTNWNGAAGTECSWYGVQCDSAQSHVTGIQFGSSISGNNLTGKLPTLSGLTALEQFDVSFNQLTGSIPALSGLKALKTFYVQANALTGSIPSLSGLTVLQALGVDSNQLTGSLPSLSGLTAMQSFSASDNKLTGAIPALTALTSLQDIKVNDNLLSGGVPAAPASLLAGQSNLCNNNLVSSGNASIDAAWVTAQDSSSSGGAGGQWVFCQLGTSPIVGEPNNPVAPPSSVQSTYTLKTGTMAAASATTEASGTLGAATVTVELDLGKAFPATLAAATPYVVYVVALVPGRQLSAAGSSLFVNTGSRGWQSLGAPIATYAQGALSGGTAGQTISLEIVRDVNLSTLMGTEIYVGVGTSEAEMLQASRYRGVYKVQ
jgi:hypothetical protein